MFKNTAACRHGWPSAIETQEIRDRSVFNGVDHYWTYLIHNEMQLTRPSAPMYIVVLIVGGGGGHSQNNGAAAGVTHTRGQRFVSLRIEFWRTIRRGMWSQWTKLNRQYSVRSETYFWTASVWPQPNEATVDVQVRKGSSPSQQSSDYTFYNGGTSSLLSWQSQYHVPEQP